MVNDHQQRMSHGHQGLFPAQSFHQTKVLTAQVAVLFHGCAPGSLYQGRAQISVAFARATRKSLTPSSFVTRTKASPTGQVSVTGKDRTHFYANLSDDHFRHPRPDPDNAVHHLAGSGQLRALLHVLIDFLGHPPVCLLQSSQRLSNSCSTKRWFTVKR